ncbi:MAG: isoprenylcysteine carboxylmethyltransferase family protein [Candidatus Eremiobacteraeota bacterium]|nr:isoprenylcysteine carboxylmethyltransferase family protein [Candidatus Eremiobacteraeota bacterium]
MSSSTPLAPWFFRKRFAIFGSVYGVSFMLGFVIAGVFGIPAQPVFLSSSHPYALATVAVTLAIGGYALRVWASSYIAASIVWTQDVQLEELRVSGPYRITRNPLYLGNLLQAIGIGMLGPWPVTALLIVLMPAYVLVLVSVEERFLAAKNGAAYSAYRATVARLIPAPGKVAADGGQRGSLRDGLRSEVLTAGFALAALLVTLWWLIPQRSAV